MERFGSFTGTVKPLRIRRHTMYRVRLAAILLLLAAAIGCQPVPGVLLVETDGTLSIEEN